MSLPYDPTATDATTNTSAFWNQLVANYEAIFDGSAFDSGITTKYGSIARYVELDSGNTTESVSLTIGSPYLVVIKDEPGSGLDTELGLFTNSVQKVGITEGGYGTSFEKVVAGVIIPTTTSFTASVQGGGPTGATVTKFIIIKLDNSASSWANSAAIPVEGLAFTANEILTGQKVNRVISNVNAQQVDREVIDSDIVTIANNTKNSMSVIANKHIDVINTPVTAETAFIATTLDFEVTENLEGSMIIVTGTAHRRETLLDWLTPQKIAIYDSSEVLVAEKEADELTWFFVMLDPLEADTYTIELTYYLGDDPNYEDEDVTAVPINITVLGFGA